MSEAKTVALPLRGKRILVTRASGQAAALSERLSALGAIPVVFPVIRIAPPPDWSALDAALIRLYAISEEQPYYTWLIFTSANAVRVCCDRLGDLGFEPRDITSTRIAAIGPATAAALAGYGLSAALVPESYIAESVATRLIAESQQGGEMLAGKRILLPRAAEARKILAVTLQQAGAVVDEIPAYITLPLATDDEQSGSVLAQLRSGQLDVITFTSSSTVRNFMRWLADNLSEPAEQGSSRDGSGRERGLACWEQDQEALPAPAVSLLKGELSYSHKLCIACIGPITAQTARESGLDVHIEADTFTIDGLVTAIVRYYRAIEHTSLPL